MPYLDQIIEKLKSKEQVDAVFLTGSHGAGRKAYSDIDLVIILKENDKKVGSLYTWIDGVFADIFFFDHADMDMIESAKELPENKMDGKLVSWLEKGVIQFDKSGKLTAMGAKIPELKKKMLVTSGEKDLFWQKISYNWVANERYFKSGDPLYYEALEIRLLYSVVEVINGYFVFRGIAWRGEKGAIVYLKEKDADFYGLFSAYTKAATFDEKFKFYSQMVQKVFPKGSRFALWKESDILPQPKGRPAGIEPELVAWWGGLIK